MVTLKDVMRANAISCIVFGTIFAIMPTSVAAFLSTDSQAPSVIVLTLGFGLIINGFHLAWASTKSTPAKKLVLYFSFGDFLWVLATACLILFGNWITSPMGVSAALLVSVLVAVLGMTQVNKLKDARTCG